MGLRSWRVIDEETEHGVGSLKRSFEFGPEPVGETRFGEVVEYRAHNPS